MIFSRPKSMINLLVPPLGKNVQSTKYWLYNTVSRHLMDPSLWGWYNPQNLLRYDGLAMVGLLFSTRFIRYLSWFNLFWNHFAKPFLLYTTTRFLKVWSSTYQTKLQELVIYIYFFCVCQKWTSVFLLSSIMID
jgi:hypothetical protein